MMMTAKILLPVLLILASPTAIAGLTYIVETDSSGNFIDGAGVGGVTNYWTGNGTVQPDVAPDPIAGTNDTLINDFSGTGTLGLGNVQLRTGDPRWFDPQDSGYSFANSGFEWSATVTLGSGTGDIVLQSPDSFLSNVYQHLQIGDLKGVDSVVFEVNFDIPLAPVRSFNAGVPYMAGVRSITDGLAANTTATILNPTFLTDNDPTAGVLDISTSSGIPSGSDFVDFGPNIGDWTDSDSHSWLLEGNATGGTGDIQGIAYLDVDGGGAEQPTTTNANDGNLDEIERFYATGMRFEFTPEGGGTFADGAAFQFSFNGAQYEDSLAQASGAIVPEPSVSLILSLGGILLLTSRRRTV